jgi:hypothetical protein
VSILAGRGVHQRRDLAGKDVGVVPGAGEGTRIETGYECNVHREIRERTSSGAVIATIDGV